MKVIIFILSLIFFNGLFSLKADQKRIDSVISEMRSMKSDTNMVNSLLFISKEYYFDNPELGFKYSKKTIDLSEKLNWKSGLAQGYAILALNYYKTSKHQESINSNQKALSLYRKMNDTTGVRDILCNLALVYSNIGNYNTAIEYFFESLKTSEELKDSVAISRTYTNIADLYNNLFDHTKAREYYQKVRNISESLNDSISLGKSISNIGSTYLLQDSVDKALEFFLISKNIRQAKKREEGLSKVLSNIGLVYLKKKEYDKAIEYFNDALKIADSLKLIEEIANIYENLGNTYYKMAKYFIEEEYSYEQINQKNQYIITSEEYLKKSIDIFLRLNEINNLMNSYFLISELYEYKSDYYNAFKFFKKYAEIKDSLLTIDSKTKIANLEAIRENEKKDSEIKILNERNKYELQQKRIITCAAAGGILLLLILAYVLYRRYRYKAKAEALLQEKNQEISNAHQRITDSITYARGIQSAVLPFDSRIRKFLKDYFILFLPKDIVSGDFYWIEKIDGKIFVVVADCTGHGVPGAFMSMIGNEMLNNIVIKQRVFNPAKVLEEMHKDVRYALKQDETVASSHDGMDVCMCVIEDKKLTFAGAKRPLYYVQNSEFFEIKGDRRSIGGRQKEEERTFSNHEILLSTETMLYLTTDGYQDQHNTRQEKFGVKRFRDLLLSISDKPMQEQKEILENTLSEFSQGEKNRDDVAVMGVRL